MKKFLINLIPNKKLRHKLRANLNKKLSFEINENTKCLMVAPHPDDEMLGAGGLLIKYAKFFDVICIGSSGIKTNELAADERADIRIEEFNKVMKKLKVNNYWIFKTFGIPPLINQIESNFNNYLNVLNLKEYDYIFLPHPEDSHAEHQYITNKLFKKLLKKQKYNKNCKIIFYEVWKPLIHSNLNIEITDVIEKKLELIDMYQSQTKFVDYASAIKGLNRYKGLRHNVCYAEEFNIITVHKYLRG